MKLTLSEGGKRNFEDKRLVDIWAFLRYENFYIPHFELVSGCAECAEDCPAMQKAEPFSSNTKKEERICAC